MPNRVTRPPEPVPCDCQRARHTHGTDRMYLIHRCGCPPCREAHRVQAARDRRAGGSNTKVPATEAQELLDQYLTAGHPLHRVAEVTGLTLRNLHDIRMRGDGKVTTITLEAIRGARPRLTEPTAKRMDATGTARRIRALNSLGWTSTQIAEAAGLARNTVDFIRSGKHAQCSAETRAKVITAYEAMWDKHPAPSTVSGRRDYTWNVNRATRNGWLPPAAWDDDRIDDPGYTPNVTTLRPTRDEEAHTRLDELQHLIDGGTPVVEAVRRAGYVTERAAYEAARHAGRATLQNTLTPSRSAAA